MVKDVKIYLLGQKRLVWVFENRGNRDKDNKSGLKEGGGIEMSTTVLSIYAIARSPSLFVFTYL